MTDRRMSRVLIADDELSIRLGCEKVLAEEGFSVTLAEDGLAALEVFRTSGPFDLVMLDLQMPGRDGISLIPEILAADPNAIIVIITGYASFETAVRAIQGGAYDYVPKPFTPDELTIVAERALEKRRFLLERDRMRAESERSLRILAHEKSRTRAIIEAMADPVMVFNSSGELVLHNPAASIFTDMKRDVTGLMMDEALSRPPLRKAILEAVELLGGAGPIIGKTQKTAPPESVVMEVAIPELSKIFSMRGSRVPDDSESGHDTDGDGISDTLGTVVVLSDITPMKELERAKSRFVSMVAHELKAPVAAIEGYIDLVIPDLAEDERGFGAKLARCRDRASTLQRMISELLDLSRIESGKMNRSVKTFDPYRVVSEAAGFLSQDAEAAGISMTICGHEGEFILGDSGELSRIVTNLVSNAIKYNRRGGSVEVETGKNGKLWLLEVRDTGIGMSQDHLKCLGEEFFRVKSSQTIGITGTGLGMSIVMRLLELNHALLEVDSVPGEGSVFRISWPLANQGSENRGAT